jgi:hypothetical protein
MRTHSFTQRTAPHIDGSEAYFRHREKAEKAAARNAASDAARRAHQELAEEYAALLRGKESSA